MKTEYRKWVRFEDPCGTGRYQVFDRVHDYPLGSIIYEKRRWVLRSKKELASIDQKYHQDITELLDHLNKRGTA